jgi:LytS/YehU family sensor histidine kinase
MSAYYTGIFLMILFLAAGLTLTIAYLIKENENKETAKAEVEGIIKPYVNEINLLKSQLSEQRHDNDILNLKSVSSLMGIHFFSNLINSFISKLLMADTIDKRVMVTEKLSDLYDILRKLLKDNKATQYNLISLKEELDITKKYISLEKLRDINIEYRLSCLADESILVPMLCIQTYVNNSVEHGFEFKAQKKGKVSIKIENIPNSNFITIEITDDGIGITKRKKINTPRKENGGNGLKYLEELYNEIRKQEQVFCGHNINEHYDKEGEVGGVIVKITIPIITIVR